MTQSKTAYSRERDATTAGADLGRQLVAGIGERPDVVFVFASSQYDHPALLRAIDAACAPALMVGSSSAGEFTREHRGEGMVSALALRSSTMQFAAGVGRGLVADREAAARQLVASFRGATDHAMPHCAAFIMTDALAGHADELVEHLTLMTSGVYQFFGGGAGDDARFSKTHVFCGTEAISDAAVGLEIRSTTPLGIGVAHGWEPAGPRLRVTEVDGSRVISINGLPAINAFRDHADATEQRLDAADPLPFFLHNIIGIDTGRGFRLRVPLAINDDGSLTCASEVPVHAIVHIMRTSSRSAAAAAATATSAAVDALGSAEPAVALVFDCVATRLRLGDDFGIELAEVASKLRGADLVGCNSYGQIARAPGQFEGFHNCTAVVCVLPA